MSSRNDIFAAVSEVLRQGLDFLETIDDAAYVTSSSGPFTASLGEHYRHVLEHFSSLADSLPTGIVDYDARQRDRQTERNRAYAIEQTLATMRRFEELSDRVLDEDCDVLYQLGYGEVRQLRVPSSAAREVVFAVSHAVHHFALIRMLSAKHGVKLDPSFGIASSTLVYRQATHAV
jgi:hypothetical protein